MHKPRRYLVAPELPQGPFYLNPCGPGFFSVVVPIARTNEVTNPSIETATIGYTASGGSIARSTTRSYHGAYSLAVTPTAALTDGAYYGTISMTAGQVRAVSCKWYGAAGVSYKLSVATTGGVDLAAYRFKGTGRWQWVWVYWVETSTTTRRLYFTKDSHASTAVFYIDGVQSEVINAGETVSTYIDGDQSALLPNQFPYPFRWNGTAHASTSTRDITTRAGGYVLNLDRFRFKLMAFAGLGVTLVANIASVGAATDGSTFQTTIASSRQVAIKGRFEAATPEQLDRLRSDLYDVVGPDSVYPRQPLTLLYQRFSGEREVGNLGRVIASYQSGLEQNVSALPAEDAVITFTQYLPAILANESGASLTVQTSVANGNAIIRRTSDGTWHAMSTGLAGGGGPIAYTIAEHPNGTIYVGGDFTSAGASGADYAAIYDPLTDTFSVISSATAFNNIVRKIAIGPSGIVYLVGDFTNAGGIAAADFIVSYNPVTGTLAALGTGANNIVVAVAVGQDGQVYAGGLNTTDFGGVAATNGAGRWDGAAWNAMTTGLDNGNVQDILVNGTDIYYVGTFTSVSGVANTNRMVRWTGAIWASLTSGTTNNSVLSVVRGPGGLLYFGGQFTTIGGVAANRHASYNGTAFQAIGGTDGLNNSVQAQAFDRSGMLHLGGLFTTADGITLPDSFARFNGSAYILGDADLPGVGTSVFALMITQDNTLYVGLDQTGTATTAGVTTVTNGGTALAYPTVTITGPTTGTSRVYQLLNATTGKLIYLDLTINAGEVVTLRALSNGATLMSTFRGDVSGAILPGSSPDFALVKGANSISFFSAATSVTALMTWANAFQSASDLTS
jgi:hypothetical protein